MGITRNRWSFMLGSPDCRTGHSIFGPLVFIAIGLMLINKSKNDKKN